MAGKTPVTNPQPIVSEEKKEEAPVVQIKESKPQPESVPEPKPEPVIPTIPVTSVNNLEKQTIREVPEDILRKALE